MKDARGHGSDAGLHSAGVQATPQLQRRHFEAIAAELKNAPDAGSPAHSQRVSEMADKLATTNPGFRRDFFIKAATGGDYTNKSRGRSSNMGAAKKYIAEAGMKPNPGLGNDKSFRYRTLRPSERSEGPKGRIK